MALTRLLVSCFHALAYQKAGFAHPFLRALALHTAAVAINSLVRTHQLRAFHRWLRSSESVSKEVRVRATAGSHFQSGVTLTEEAESRSKVKVQ